jgi:hypothetical protein
MIINNNNWPAFAKAVAAPSDPLDYSPAAVDRLMKYLDPFVVRIENIRPQFKCYNACERIDFQTSEDLKKYKQAWDRFCENVNKLKESDGPQTGIMIIVEQLVFRMAASLIKAPYLAKRAYESVINKGKAAAIGVNFKPTVAKICNILYQDYNIPRDQISLIWGGDNAFNKKLDVETNEVNDIIERIRNGEFVPKKEIQELKRKLTYANEGLSELPNELRLGMQSKKARQEEIDRYQRGDSKFAIYTFKSGGVGLSLHHSDDQCKYKVKRKKGSNYAYEDDIPNVTTLPREGFFEPTYSGIETVQGAGRLPRLTSLSDTYQYFLYFRNTIEERVMRTMSQKLRCLKQVVRSNEHWEDIILSAATSKEQSFSDATLDDKIIMEINDLHEIEVDNDEEEDNE